MAKGTFHTSADGSVRCDHCQLHPDQCHCDPYRFLCDLLEYYDDIHHCAEDVADWIANHAERLRRIVLDLSKENDR